MCLLELEEFKCISNSPIKIFVGSQTGTGEALASTLSKELFKRSIVSKITLLSEYNIRELSNETLVLFIVSTYGQGEPPTMMRVFIYIYSNYDRNSGIF